MNQNYYTAIVVALPSPQRFYVTLFTEIQGVIEVRLARRTRQAIARGSLIVYQELPSRAIQLIDIIAVPDQWMCEDLYFFHHFLEMLDFFLQRHQHEPEVYALCQAIYAPYTLSYPKSLFKKLLLCKFFIMLGIYPEPKKIEDIQFFNSITGPLGEDFAEEKCVFLEKKMVQWLRECLMLHPAADRLKTSNFLVM